MGANRATRHGPGRAVEKAQEAVQAATLAGAETTQAATHAATRTRMARGGSIALNVGMFIGRTIAKR
jgi:hypothetical protein